MRKLVVLASSMLALFTVLTFMSAPKIHAESASTPVTTTTVDVQKIDANQCAALQKAYPQRASDPDLCLRHHKQIVTRSGALAATKTNAITPLSSCSSGWENFDDYYWTADAFQVEMVTNWTWYGDCGIPSLDYQDCHVNWTYVVSIDQTTCGSYTTGVPSRAALWTGMEHEWIGAWRIWARRECYTGVFNCNWHTDLG